MPDSTNKSKRIAKNTIVLYFRMLFLMLVNLYTSRVILDVLGVQDYGIYNVVAGFIMMMNMINLALINANSRFINYEMGRGDDERLTKVFSTALNVHFGIATCIILVAETIGLWYLNNKMVIPEDRIVAANWCFQFSMFNFCMVMINIPYRACIIAHEKMKTFAYVSIIDGVGQLFISYAVLWNPFDRLIYYALLLFLLQNTVRYIYQSYCRRHFKECHYRRVFDKSLIKQMMGFATWNVIGNGATTVKTYGGNLILNLFFGPTVNAARGLSIHVNNAVSSFSTNFLMAITPQITQSYAKQDYGYMLMLMTKGARYSYYVLFILSLPLILNADYILHIWLKEVPPYTEIFVQLALVDSILYGLTRPFVTGQNATGKIRNFQLVIGMIELLNLPFCYIALKLGNPPYYVMIVAVVMELLSVFARIYMLPKTLPFFNPITFIKEVMISSLFVTIISIIIPLLVAVNIPESFASFIVICMVCLISTLTTIYFVGLDKKEKLFMMSKTKKILHIKA